MNSGEINPIVIKNKISFSLIPLSAIIYSKKYDFIWNENKLILNEDTFKEGISLKINFKILNFEGNYDSFKFNYSLISLEDNNIERPKVGFESDDNSALFKLKIPKLMDDTKNSFHALFSLYISKNLIIPIEIKSKINKRDFGLFYYNKYTNEILNHTSYKEIIIYKYNEKRGNIYVMGRINLYFRIQCNDNLDEKDDTEHSLTIKVPEADRLLSFDLTKDEQNKKFKDGITIKLPITISNFSSQVEYDNLNNYINTKRFEVEFICDGTSKTFIFKFVIEKALVEGKIRYLSVPYFIHKGNEFKKLDETNYDELSKANDIYFNYDKTNYIKKNDKYKINEIRTKTNKIEFISEECKLIFIIKDFKINHNITIWGPYEDFKQYKKFYNSELDINKTNIEKAKKEDEEIYSKLKKKRIKKFEDEIKKDFQKIERMTQFIRYIYSENIPKGPKIELLVKISQCFEEQDKEKIMNIVKDYNECSDNNYLPIFYHNIIFSIGNIFQNHVLMLEKCDKNYLFVLEKKLSPKLIKEFNEEDFEKNVKEIFCKKNEGLNISRIYQFNEFSGEPQKIEKIPKQKKNKKNKGEELKTNNIEILTENLTKYKNNIKNINTIDKGIELIKNSYNITQNFPFIIQKISNKELNNLFQALYAVYDKFADYNKNIISEDSYKFCLLFQNLCKKLKNKVNLDDFEKIKVLEIDTNVESTNLIEYPRLKDINIPKEKKWNQIFEEKANIKYLDLANFEKLENETFIQPKLKPERKIPDVARQSFRYCF